VKRLSKLIVLLTALSAVAVACGDDDDDDNTAATTGLASTATAGTSTDSSGATGTTSSETTASSSGATTATSSAGGGDTCGPNATSTAEDETALEELVAAAEAEGSVNVDNNPVTEGYHKRLAEAFEEAFPGVSVNLVRTGDEVTLRTTEEQLIQAGRADFDITVTASFGALDTWRQNGWLMDLSGLPCYSTLPEAFQQDETVGIEVTPFVMAYNSDVVDPADVPENYDDLGDPAFRSLIGITDPSRSPAVGEAQVQIFEKFGIEAFEGIGENDPKLYGLTSEMGQALAAGEVGIGPFQVLSVLKGLTDAGAPIEIINTADVPTVLVEHGIYSEAEHPSAAQLYLYWLVTSEEAEQIRAEEAGRFGSPSFSSDDLGALHPAMAGISGDQLLSLTDRGSASEEVRTRLARTLGY
jgi:iron(III) transport system substrate-binding protein